MYNMGFFNKGVELIPPKKQNTNTKTIKVKSLNGYDAIRGKWMKVIQRLLNNQW